MSCHLCSKFMEFLSDDSGSSLLEFSASISVLLILMFGIIGLSLAAYADHFVALAAQAGTRYASVRGSTWTGSCATVTSASCITSAAMVQTYVQSIAPSGVTKSNLVVQATWPGTTPSGGACYIVSGNNSQGCMVKVSVQYSFSYLLPFLPKNVLKLSSTGALPIAQ